jgi:spermidine synthase
MTIGFLIGFEIPIIMRILKQQNIGIKQNLQIVYAMDYIGGFVFAVLWVTVLLTNFPLTEISFIVAGFNYVVALITIVFFVRKKLIVIRKRIIAVLIFTGIALIFGYTQNQDWSRIMEQKFYKSPIVFTSTSKYQHLVLTSTTKVRDVRLFINGSLQFSSTDEQRYHDLLVHPVMALKPDAKHVLILGGGDGLALRELNKYTTLQSSTLVDLDPEMVKFASNNSIMKNLNKNSFHDARVFVQKNSGVTGLGKEGVYMETGKKHADATPKTELVAQVSVYSVDADRFVSELHSGKKWDVIIIDFPDPRSVELAKLYSREFYLKLQWQMSQGAMIAIQSTSPFYAKETFLAIGRTMRSAGLKTLPYHWNIPSFGEWGFHLAWKGDTSEKAMMQKLKSIQSFEVETSFITPEVMLSSFVFGKQELQSHSKCVNALMYPCLQDTYTKESWLIN